MYIYIYIYIRNIHIYVVYYGEDSIFDPNKTYLFRFTRKFAETSWFPVWNIAYKWWVVLTFLYAYKGYHIHP